VGVNDWNLTRGQIGGGLIDRKECLEKSRTHGGRESGDVHLFSNHAAKIKMPDQSWSKFVTKGQNTIIKAT